MTLPRLLKTAAATTGLIAAGVILFDLAAYFLFPDVVREIEPKYASEVGAEILSQAHVEPYYQASPTRGFDIAPGARSLDWHPPDVAPYPIWGNSLGCFDDEPPADTAPDIYLAGDSFTWGFSPYEKKFGTIMERETGRLVYACGVWNTGQWHQFDKFLEIAGSFPGWPRLLIVNLYDNDYLDDLAFPHTTVVNGVLVETKYLTRENGKLKVHDSTDFKTVVPSIDVKYFLKGYSATANILNVFMRQTVNNEALGHYWVGSIPDAPTYPIRSEDAAANRQIISQWLDHARKNGYAIRFSLIPDSYNYGKGVYRELKKFLTEKGAVVWDFENYVLENGIEPRELYWPIDIHFNPKGNAVYARFLMQMLDAEARAGALPARFAARQRSGQGAMVAGDGGAAPD